MIQEQTIKITNYKHFRAISMVWGKHINRRDVKFAFDEINAMLNALSKPVCVVVDLQDNAFIPLADTFKGALFGPHRNPNLAAWLVVGENTFAHSVADMLNRFGDSQKIQWYRSIDEVDEFLEETCPYA